MSDDLERILNSGNLEEIDKLLEAADAADNGDSAALESVLKESGDTGETVSADPPSQEEPAAKADAEPLPVIRAKDGVHEIPFSVLEEERRQSAALNAQLRDLQRRNELLEQQLTSANIAPKQLPETIRFTPEQIAEAESYGELGQMVATLAQQNAVLMDRLSQATAPQTVVTEKPHNPFAENPDTLRWAQNDAQWGVLEGVNSILDADPAWAGKSLAERIPEIVRRTKFALGEASEPSIDQAATAALQRAQRVAPNSLTDVGGEIPGSSKPVSEQLADADMAAVQSYLEKQIARGVSIDQALTSVL